MARIERKNKPEISQNQKKGKIASSKIHQKKASIKIENTDIFDDFIGKKSFLISLSLILLISFFVFKDFYFLKKIFLFKDIGSDSINVDYPWMVMINNLRDEQGFFTWTFYSGLGYPVFSGVVNIINPYLLTNLVTQPLFQLFYGSNPAFLKFPYLIFNLILIGIVSFFYFKTIGLSKYTTIIGSLLVPFMGYAIACSSWNTYLEVFYGIFLLFSFEQLYKCNRWYFFPIAILFLSGNFFNVYIYGLFLITYIFFRFFSENGMEYKRLGLLLLKIGGLTILGLGLNTVNFAGDIVNAINSPRVAGNVSLLTEAAQNPLMTDTGYQHSTAFLRLFSSDLVGTAEQFKGWYNYLEAPLFYCGLICILLVFQVFTRLSKREKITYGTFIGFWLLVVLLPGLRHAIHLWLGEYYKVGINFFIPITLIFFAMQALSRIERENKINKPVLIISLIAILISLFIPYKIGDVSLVDEKIRSLVLVFIIIYGLLIYLFVNERFKSIAKPALLLLVIIELIVFSNISISSRKAYSAREFKQLEGGYKDNTLDALSYIKSRDKSFFRFEKDYFSGNAIHASLNDAQAQRYFGTTLYSSFNQPYYIKFLQSMNIIQPGIETQTRWAPGLRSRPLLQTMASVKYNVSKSSDPFMLKTGYKTMEKFGDVSLMQNEYFIPFGFCYDTFITGTDFDKLSNLQKDIALLRCFVLDEKAINKDVVTKNLSQVSFSDTVSAFDFNYYKNFVEKRRKDTLEITEFKHDKISGTVNLDSSRMMFFSIPYDKYWNAKVDGKIMKPELVNIGFIGLPLDKGKHTIELFYLPDYFYYALALSILATLIYIVLFYFSKEFKLKTKLIYTSIFLIAYLINVFVV